MPCGRLILYVGLAFINLCGSRGQLSNNGGVFVFLSICVFIIF